MKPVLGSPASRVEGNLKVTGQALFTADLSLDSMAFAFPVRATIARGEVLSITDEKCRQLDGYLGMVTHENRPKFSGVEHPAGSPYSTEVAMIALENNKVQYFGQFVAVVMAESYEVARQAASLVELSYRSSPARADLDAALPQSVDPKKINVGMPSDTLEGQPDLELSRSDVEVDVEYRTPMEHHHPMEPHASIAHWQSDELHLHYPAQILNSAVASLAKTFHMPKDKIRVTAPFVGGGFGGKLNLPVGVGLAVIAAKVLNRPVKLVHTRQQLFTDVGFRQENRMAMKLGAQSDGTITALKMESRTHTASYRRFVEQTGALARFLYSSKSSQTSHRVTVLDTHVPNRMRAPGEAPGSFALESAIDELAVGLGMDPIALRIANEPEVDPESGLPWSSRNLTECMVEGGRTFGWDKRSQEPRSKKKGRDWVGYGMAAAARPAYYREASARVTLTLDGGQIFAKVALAATDIGTGSMTIVAQTAAERLGLSLKAVTVELGDSELPPTPGSGGSWGAASYSCAVDAVCEQLLNQLPEGVNLLDRLRQCEGQKMSVTATEKPHPKADQYAKYAFGAHFCEVHVDEDLGQIRVERFHSAIAGGRILNPKTARSQILGGIVWGISQALFEESILDPKMGSWLTRSLADYHIPVNLDIGELTVEFVGEPDYILNRLGVKGIGELGLIGVASCVANAVYNATGRRARWLPITPARLLAAQFPGTSSPAKR